MQAKAKFEGARISFKNSIIVCKAIRGLSLEKGKKFLEDLIAKRRSLDGKYYTNAAKKILEILKNAEANAKQKNLNLEKLFIFAKADKGFRLITPKSRAKFRGRKAKVTNIEIVLEER
jgi:ribosomal protein L22